MTEHNRASSRRRFLKLCGSLSAAMVMSSPRVSARAGPAIARSIPKTGEPLPVIGMGSWLTFDVGNDPPELATRVQILQTFFDSGGAVIDSSPMYGSSEKVIGYCLKQIGKKDALFAATKVWIVGRRFGIVQMKRSESLWGTGSFGLMQIHNLVDWETHLRTLKDWKAQGKIRYIGITTSHGRRHADLEKAIATEPFDFVQFTYNMRDREAERRLLPLAAERGIAVIINRPFRRGRLFDYIEDEPLPGWASEFDCENWAQYFLKFIVSHPAVTCAIPATSQVPHMQENMGAGFGLLPDAKMRRRMVRHFEALI
jgi:diketogulonate reductase-like aldo/keto reductase